MQITLCLQTITVELYAGLVGHYTRPVDNTIAVVNVMVYTLNLQRNSL